MDKDSKFTRDSDGYIAVRTVSGTEALPAIDKDYLFARDTNGNIAMRVVGSDGGGGGSDPHNLGWYATQSALETAHPTATAGDWAIVGSTDTVWIWDTDNDEWVDSDQKGQVTSVNGQTGAVTVSEVPSQTGNAGKFLTTDGTDASWSDKPLANLATGTSSLSIMGEATARPSSVVIGELAKGAASNGSACVALGAQAKATGNGSTAIGKGSEAIDTECVAIGNGAHAYGIGSVQIKYGTNNTPNTVQIGSYTVLSADGTIPTDRLTKVNTTITLTAAGWSSNTQTVNVTGMTAAGVVFPSPDPADQSAYTSAGILCTAQAAGTLTFTCDTVPSADIDVNVVML